MRIKISIQPPEGINVKMDAYAIFNKFCLDNGISQDEFSFAGGGIDLKELIFTYERRRARQFSLRARTDEFDRFISCLKQSKPDAGYEWLSFESDNVHLIALLDDKKQYVGHMVL